jgi:TPR repeat protein
MMVPRLLSFACCALLCGQISLSVCRADDLNIETLKKSAEQGDPEAQISLGGAYFTGERVPKDYQQAAEWIRKAAERGNAKAQYNLGVFYKRGYGVQQDVAEALKWYRKSAEQDFAEAELELGRLYYFGDVGIDKNYSEAANWVTNCRTWKTLGAKHAWCDVRVRVRSRQGSKTGI